MSKEPIFGKKTRGFLVSSLSQELSTSDDITSSDDDDDDNDESNGGGADREPDSMSRTSSSHSPPSLKSQFYKSESVQRSILFPKPVDPSQHMTRDATTAQMDLTGDDTRSSESPSFRQHSYVNTAGIPLPEKSKAVDAIGRVMEDHKSGRIIRSSSSLTNPLPSNAASNVHCIRKSRSRERAHPDQQTEAPGCISPHRDMDRIHRRSIELLMMNRSPAYDPSPDRMSGRAFRNQQDNRMTRATHGGSGIAVEGWRPVSAPVNATFSCYNPAPPPLPPRIQSPSLNSSGANAGVQGSGNKSRYTVESSGAFYSVHSNQDRVEGLQRLQRQSPQQPRDPYKSPIRDLRSPTKHWPVSRAAFLPEDQDEDSGADSLHDQLPSSCHSGCLHHHHHHHHNLQHQIPAASAHHSLGCPAGGMIRSSPHHCCCYPHSCHNSIGNLTAGLNLSNSSLPCTISGKAPTASSPSRDTRIIALENEKESLRMQIAVLSEQIASQTNKISELQKVLDDKRDVLRKTEDLLQREMLNRSSLETQKLELLSELSALKLRQASVEKENLELRKNLARSFEMSQSFFSTLPLFEDASGFSSLKADNKSINTFGTLPRRPLKSRGTVAPVARPLETHFGTATTTTTAATTASRQLSSAQSGSAPSLPLANDSIRKIPLPASSEDTSRQSRARESFAHKAKGLKKILGRMRRSRSGSLMRGGSGGDDKRREETAVPSLDPACCSSSDPSLPFRQWKVETVCAWMEHLGLFMYNADVRRHVRCGEDLLTMQSHDLDLRLGIKNSLHRKKLLLALRAKRDCPKAGSLIDLAGRLDHQWVLSWLDDIGLPQYKERFLEARVDGRMLHLLCVEDLVTMRITNMLHHLSLKSAIKALRKARFDANCYKYSSNQQLEESNKYCMMAHECAAAAPRILFWSNQRVIEWLKAADMGEYAYNLRGSGVHGALIVLEPKFTAELLAALLSIPTTKTLLRRHLGLHFKDLVGKEVMQSKREAEKEPEFQMLTPTSKVKPHKNQRLQSFYRSRRILQSERHSQSELEDILCPFESEVGHMF